MKRVLSILFICSFFLAFTGKDSTNEGINFREDAWRDIAKEAKAEGKPIFVLFHADWCPKCAKMKESVFPDPEVGAYFNDKFISVMMDTEEPQNNMRASSWGVHGVPTMVFLDSKKDIVHVARGLMDKKELLAEAAKAMKKM